MEASPRCGNRRYQGEPAAPPTPQSQVARHGCNVATWLASEYSLHGNVFCATLMWAAMVLLPFGANGIASVNSFIHFAGTRCPSPA